MKVQILSIYYAFPRGSVYGFLFNMNWRVVTSHCSVRARVRKFGFVLWISELVDFFTEKPFYLFNETLPRSKNWEYYIDDIVL